MEERRRYVRFKATDIAEFESQDALPDIPAMTKDISQAGACVYSNIYIEPGRYTKVKLHKGEAVETKDAIIAWANMLKDKIGPVWQIGLNIPE